MLAERAALPNINVHPQEMMTQSKEQPTVPKRRRRWKHRSRVMKGSLLLFFYAAFLVGLQLKSSMLSYEITNLKQEISTLQTVNNRYEYQIQQLSALDRIEAIATQELNMVKPEWNHAYTVAKMAIPSVVAEDCLIQPTVIAEPEKPIAKIFGAFRQLGR